MPVRRASGGGRTGRRSDGGDARILCVGNLRGEEREKALEACCERWKAIPVEDATIGQGFVDALKEHGDKLSEKEKGLLAGWPPVQLRAVRNAFIEVCCAAEPGDPKIHTRKGPAKSLPAVRIDITDTQRGGGKIREIAVTFQHPEIERRRPPERKKAARKKRARKKTARRR